ncbi:MAG: hypothetical protein JXB26_05755 [Candidatus Aminicenantes bacterium]|nr:hypothetical protein [Candidatus Aminicenantes bacterium]
MEERIGIVTHYFAKISVAVMEMKEGRLHTGDTLHIKGHTTDFYQNVSSMQIEHEPVSEVKAGQEFAFKVESPVREHDVVFRVTDEENTGIE